MEEKYLRSKECVPDNEVWVSPKTFDDPFSKNAAEALKPSHNRQSTPLICDCGDHITGDYAFVGGKYLCPVCMEW